MGSRSVSELCSDVLYLLICGSVGLYSLLVQLVVSLCMQKHMDSPTRS